MGLELRRSAGGAEAAVPTTRVPNSAAQHDMELDGSDQPSQPSRHWRSSTLSRAREVNSSAPRFQQALLQQC
mgnify:CR=1 FL=1